MSIRATKFLRREAVEDRIGLSRATIYKLISEQKFPRPVPIGQRAVAWVEDEIQEWIDKKIRQAKRGEK